MSVLRVVFSKSIIGSIRLCRSYNHPLKLMKFSVQSILNKGTYPETPIISQHFPKGGFKLADTGEFLHLQHKYSKSLSWVENMNFLPKRVNNLFKFSAQNSDLEYLCMRRKIFLVPSDVKPPLSYQKLTRKQRFQF